MKPGKKATKARARKGEARGKHRAGLIDRLLACPVKDFFVPLPSESTRSLKPWTSQVLRSTATA